MLARDQLWWPPVPGLGRGGGIHATGVLREEVCARLLAAGRALKGACKRDSTSADQMQNSTLADHNSDLQADHNSDLQAARQNCDPGRSS
eukprot:3274210-Rhodomonas_salina.1